jgi:hypothetical protein
VKAELVILILTTFKKIIINPNTVYYLLGFLIGGGAGHGNVGMNSCDGNVSGTLQHIS